ncbi:MAG: hypothetical protein LBC43_02415 [Bifidobacteriaceae bacterium]|nr:hypothetical protein [Bifidobacteriaceae bacterium]
MELEFCSEGFRKVPEAIEAGIDRVELCLDLRAQGLTPPLEIIEKTVEYCHQYDVTVATMVRPKADGFVFDFDYPDKLLEEVAWVVKTDTDSIVLGCLTSDNLLDIDLLAAVSDLVDRRCELVFHNAFNQIIIHRPEYIEEALSQLIDLGYVRLLTHGGNTQNSVLENAENFKKIHNFVNGRMQIMAGGGVSWKNINQIDQALKLDAYHGTQIVRI